MIEDVDELIALRTGDRQIEYTVNVIMSRVSTYRENKYENASSRTCPVTWNGIKDTMYLP